MPALPGAKGLPKGATLMELAKIRLAQIEGERMTKEMKAADYRRELDALDQQRIALQRQLEQAQRAEKEEFLSRIAELMREGGVTFDDLKRRFDSSAAKAKAKKSTSARPPRYVNPDNPTETATGFGKPPKWLAALVEKGRKKEEFLIR